METGKQTNGREPGIVCSRCKRSPSHGTSCIRSRQHPHYPTEQDGRLVRTGAWAELWPKARGDSLGRAAVLIDCQDALLKINAGLDCTQYLIRRAENAVKQTEFLRQEGMNSLICVVRSFRKFTTMAKRYNFRGFGARNFLSAQRVCDAPQDPPVRAQLLREAVMTSRPREARVLRMRMLTLTRQAVKTGRVDLAQNACSGRSAGRSARKLVLERRSKARNCSYNQVYP